MVRFAELMGADEGPEKGQPNGGSVPTEVHPDDAGEVARAASTGSASPAGDAPAPTLPPDSGAPTPANGPTAVPTVAGIPASQDTPGRPSEDAETDINDDLIPRRKGRR